MYLTMALFQFRIKYDRYISIYNGFFRTNKFNYNYCRNTTCKYIYTICCLLTSSLLISMFQKCIHDLHMYIHFCDKLIIFLCVSCKNIIVGSRRFRLRYIRISERQFNEIKALIHNKNDKNNALYI